MPNLTTLVSNDHGRTVEFDLGLEIESLKKIVFHHTGFDLLILKCRGQIQPFELDLEVNPLQQKI